MMSNQQKNVEIWYSKLGGQYPKEEIERNHQSTIEEISTLRKQPANKLCADCGTTGTIWSSVNLGVFTCLRCGSLHRALGTHISKPKGLQTYLWGPDELQRMKDIGNERAEDIYGGKGFRPSADAPDSEWLEYLRNKYERRCWANEASGNTSGQQKSDRNEEQSRTARVQTEDLLGLSAPSSTQQKSSKEYDFFAEFNV